jgi:dolichyl-phosphate beta-glucosyltransferase
MSATGANQSNRPSPVNNDPGIPEEPVNPTSKASVSIVIPAYNEARRLPSTLDRIASYLAAQRFLCCEVIVVDDGSQDSTVTIAQAFASSRPYVRVIASQPNRGKGHAVRQGVLRTTGEWVLFTDADLSTPIEELDNLLAVARQTSASVVIGSRALDRSVIEQRQGRLRECAGRVFNLLARTLTGINVRDSQCGFKLYRGDAAHQIFSRQRLDGFSFDVEDLVIARQLRYRVQEVPVRWKNAPGTKVTSLAGLKSFGDLLTIWWNQVSGSYAPEPEAPLAPCLPGSNKSL